MESLNEKSNESLLFHNPVPDGWDRKKKIFIILRAYINYTKCITFKSIESIDICWAYIYISMHSFILLVTLTVYIIIRSVKRIIVGWYQKQYVCNVQQICWQDPKIMHSTKMLMWRTDNERITSLTNLMIHKRSYFSLGDTTKRFWRYLTLHDTNSVNVLTRHYCAQGWMLNGSLKNKWHVQCMIHVTWWWLQAILLLYQLYGILWNRQAMNNCKWRMSFFPKRPFRKRIITVRTVNTTAHSKCFQRNNCSHQWTQHNITLEITIHHNTSQYIASHQITFESIGFFL